MSDFGVPGVAPLWTQSFSVVPFTISEQYGTFRNLGKWLGIPATQGQRLKTSGELVEVELDVGKVLVTLLFVGYGRFTNQNNEQQSIGQTWLHRLGGSTGWTWNHTFPFKWYSKVQEPHGPTAGPPNQMTKYQIFIKAWNGHVGTEKDHKISQDD